MLPAIPAIVALLAGTLLFLLVAILLVVRAVRRQPVPWKSSLGILLVTVALMIWSGISLFLQGVVYVREKAPEAAKLGREAVSETIHQGTTAVAEGFGKTGTYFEEKWAREAKANLSRLNVTCRSAKVSVVIVQGNVSCAVELVVENPTDRDVDFRDILRIGQPLLEDAEGVSYPPSPACRDVERSLPAGTKTLHAVTYDLPPDTKPAFIQYGDTRKAPVPAGTPK